MFQKLIAWVLVIVGACAHLLPAAPRGEKLNLDGYRLVFEDEFDGDALDEAAWYYRASGLRRCGCNAPSQVRVENGRLRNGRIRRGLVFRHDRHERKIHQRLFRDHLPLQQRQGFLERVLAAKRPFL